MSGMSTGSTKRRRYSWSLSVASALRGVAERGEQTAMAAAGRLTLIEHTMIGMETVKTNVGRPTFSNAPINCRNSKLSIVDWLIQKKSTVYRNSSLCNARLFRESFWVFGVLSVSRLISKVALSAQMTHVGIDVHAYGAATVEGRTGHKNEDRFVMAVGRPNFHAFAVMDGHGGSKAADFIKKRLMLILDAAFQTAGRGRLVVKRLEQAIEDLDREFCRLAKRENDTSGACLLVTILYTNEAMQPQLLVLNTGDCRVILSETNESNNGSTQADNVVAITKDHCAANSSEKLRIVRRGGSFTHGRVAGVMEPTRSLGDIDMKTKDMRGWIIATPEVYERGLVGQTTLVLATDGVWSVLENVQVMQIALEQLGNASSENCEAEAAAQAIVQAAQRAGSLDDITAIVVAL